MIIISEPILEPALKPHQATFNIHYDPELFQKRDELKALLKNASALIVRNQTQVDTDLIAKADNLKVVGRLGVGLDNLDIPALKERGVVVTWGPGTNAVSVAEYVLGAMLELSRRFTKVSAELHSGAWNRQAAIGTELYGKTLGIVGLGDIGSRLARRAHAFSMKVVAHDPVVYENAFAPQEYGVGLLELPEVLKSDFVSLHAPLLPSTKHLVNAESLKQMKPSACLINTARGGLVDEHALAHALRNGTLAGAALDVRASEPPGEDDPLRGLENVILTPHIAGVTLESNTRVSFHVVQDVVRVLQGQAPLSRAPGSA